MGRKLYIARLVARQSLLSSVALVADPKAVVFRGSGVWSPEPRDHPCQICGSPRVEHPLDLSKSRADGYGRPGGSAEYVGFQDARGSGF